MIKNFLFLKLTDPEICNLLWGLREIFEKEKKFASSIHVTVRGPNKNEFKNEVIQNLYKKIEDDSIIIQSAGKFDNEDYQVVYIKVSSTNLHKIWRKPDYPKEEFGINPHITLYTGPDKEYANCIYDFLKNENIALLCNSFELIPYQTKQMKIPYIESELNLTENGFSELINKGKLSLSILERAKNIVSNFNCTKGSERIKK
ncbi:MAG: hypothetical protein OEY89_07020 [Gammaproteobacteria bacterium]|nr:hypothetical protein [Gammaproteobacteria bacterium]